MAQQGWQLKHCYASWGVGTHGFIEFSAVASNSDSPWRNAHAPGGFRTRQNFPLQAGAGDFV